MNKLNLKTLKRLHNLYNIIDDGSEYALNTIIKFINTAHDNQRYPNQDFNDIIEECIISYIDCELFDNDADDLEAALNKGV